MNADQDAPKKSMPKLILVDFDDTLVETAPAFQAAREALFELLARVGFPEEEAVRVHHEVVEPELMDLFGMGPSRMDPSFRDTYLRLSSKAGRPPDPSVAEEAASLGRDFLGTPTVMEGVLDALGRLAARKATAIYTQASHPVYQMERIRLAGVTEIIPEDRIRIAPRKTTRAFRETLEHFGVASPDRAVMVGNSMRSDINPALEAGARALLVVPYEMWWFDNVPPFSEDFLRFQGFPQAVAHLLGDGGG